MRTGRPVRCGRLCLRRSAPALDPRPSLSQCVAELPRHRRAAVAGGDRAPQGWRALLRGSQDGGLAELAVGLELGGVVQLLQRAITRVGRVILGVGEDVPGRFRPPAELTYPDVA